MSDRNYARLAIVEAAEEVVDDLAQGARTLVLTLGALETAVRRYRATFVAREDPTEPRSVGAMDA